MLADDLFQVFKKAFKAKISEECQSSTPPQPLKILMSQSVQCDLISQVMNFPNQFDQIMKGSAKIKESTMMESEIQEPAVNYMNFAKNLEIEKPITQQIAEGFVKKASFGPEHNESKVNNSEEKKDEVKELEPPEAKQQLTEEVQESPTVQPEQTQEAKIKNEQPVKKEQSPTNAPDSWQLSTDNPNTGKNDAVSEKEKDTTKKPQMAVEKAPIDLKNSKHDTSSHIEWTIKEEVIQGNDFFGDSHTQTQGHSGAVNFFDFGEDSTKVPDTKQQKSQTQGETTTEKKSQDLEFQQGFKKKDVKKEIAAGEFDGFFGEETSGLKSSQVKNSDSILKPLQVEAKVTKMSQNYEDFWDFDGKQADQMIGTKKDHINTQNSENPTQNFFDNFQEDNKKSVNQIQSQSKQTGNSKAEGVSHPEFTDFGFNEGKPAEISTIDHIQTHKSQHNQGTNDVQEQKVQTVPQHPTEKSSQETPLNISQTKQGHPPTPVVERQVVKPAEQNPLEISHSGMIGGTIVGFNDFESVEMSISLIDHQPIGPQNFLHQKNDHKILNDSPKGANETEILNELWQPSLPMTKQSNPQPEVKASPIDTKIHPEFKEQPIIQILDCPPPISALSDQPKKQEKIEEKKPLTLNLAQDGAEEGILGLPINLTQPLETPKDPNFNLFAFDDLLQQPANNQQSYLSREFLTSSHVSLAPFPVMDDLGNFTTDKLIQSTELRPQNENTPIVPLEKGNNSLNDKILVDDFQKVLHSQPVQPQLVLESGIKNEPEAMNLQHPVIPPTNMDFLDSEPIKQESPATEGQTSKEIEIKADPIVLQDKETPSPINDNLDLFL